MNQDKELKYSPFLIKVLLFSTFIVSMCGLTYELAIGSLSKDLLGNPVLQYSLTIGFFMSALGLGSYLSRFINKNLLSQFIIIEIILGIVGGLSIPLLYFVFIKMSTAYMYVNILVLILVGMLVGLEIPIITRILKDFNDIKETLSNVLTLDYVGGLAASLLFPLVLYPFNLIVASFLIGSLNLLIGILNLVVFSKNIPLIKKQILWFASILSLLGLISGIVYYNEISGFFRKSYYGTVVYHNQSRYQEIILSMRHGNTELYLNNQLQFSSIFEYRYHEALIFPAFYLKENIETVLIMGGGDGLGVRQLLKFPQIKKIVLVDLDPAITDLARDFELMREINKDAFHNPKVEIINEDAYKYLGTTPYTFDVIYADFPDPNDGSLAKLYSHEMYYFVKRRLKKDGILITQATSPYYAKECYWCISKTLKTVFKAVVPYHVDVPHMGDWGFHIASDNIEWSKEHIESKLITLKNEILSEDKIQFFDKNCFIRSLMFPKDMLLKQDDVKVNTFTEPVIYKYFEEGWKHFYRN